MGDEVAVQTAAPASATPEVSVPTKPAEYAEWRTKGISAEPTKKEESATSVESAAKPAETVSEPEAEKKQEPRGKLSAKERAEQLKAENSELQAELDKRAKLRRELAQPDEKKPAESSTVDAKAPVKPKSDDFKTWDEYETARDKYFEDVADYKASKAVADDRVKRAQEVQQKEMQEKWNDGKKRYTDFEKVINPVINTVLSDPQIPAIVKAMVNDSPVIVDLLYTLGGDANELHEFLQLAKTNPLGAVRKLAITEDLVRQELGKKGTARDESGQFTKAPEKKSTEAPPPPSEVSGRGSTPADEVESAAKKDDFRTFREAANRRDLQRRKGI